MKKLLMLTVALLALTGCDSDKDKAIKAAEAKITAMTDNITGITFSDMEYHPAENGYSCVFGKYRTDQKRETRFVLVLDKDFKVDDSVMVVEDHRYPGVQDFVWEDPCN